MVYLIKSRSDHSLTMKITCTVELARVQSFATRKMFRANYPCYDSRIVDVIALWILRLSELFKKELLILIKKELRKMFIVKFDLFTDRLKMIEKLLAKLISHQMVNY